MILFPFHLCVHVQAGFLSIDCGLEANYSGYNSNLGIVYVSDEPYVDAGENHQVSDEFKAMNYIRPYVTLRSFPSGVRNCYALPTIAGAKYLVRLEFLYGNYDGKNISSLQFDLYLGVNRWTTVQYFTATYTVHEALFVAWASWAPVCLVNTGQGTPFVSTVELRPLGRELYPTVMANQSMAMRDRRSMGQTNVQSPRYVIPQLYCC